MTESLDKLNDLKSKMQAAERKRARQEAELDNINSSLKEISSRLQEEFAVSSLDDAKQLQETLSEQLTEKLREIESELDKV